MAGSLVLPILLASAAPATTPGWVARPGLSIGGGAEDDLILGADSTAVLVPGGSFLELVPSLAADRRLGRRTHLRLEGRAHLQRFLNESERWLGAGALQGDLFLAAGRGLAMRLSSGATYFTDSERPEIERLDGAVELAGGGGGRRWRLEALAGASGRTYSELTILDEGGLAATYRESGLEAGGALFLRPWGSSVLQLRLTRQRTEADDPLNAARAWSWRGSARLGLARSLRLLLQAGGQERTYPQRIAGLDGDSYFQVGAAVEHSPRSGVDLVLRHAYSRYEDPLGESTDSQRIAFAVGLRFGRAAGAPAGPSLPQVEPAPAPREGEPFRFRVRVPGAGQVAVVGDFNGWDATAGALSPAGDGWWEAAFALPSGTHEYAYLADGRSLTPPEAVGTVPDGFGGRNGLLRVLPARSADPDPRGGEPAASAP